jgi:hypothetical protein
MQITPDQALESVQSIFKSLDWEIELRNDPPAILTGFHIDKTRDAIVAIALDDERRSIILGCSYRFQTPKDQRGKIRRFLFEESQNLYGTNIHFSSSQGVNINTRCWLPDLPLASDDLRAVVEPYLKSVLKIATCIFPALIRFLREQERLRPQDGFYLPS